MITDYIEAALSKAKYELIEDEEPFFWRSARVRRCVGEWQNAGRIP